MTPPRLRQRQAGCPAGLQLDELLAGDLAGTSDEVRLRDHLVRCDACRAHAAARQAEPAVVPDPSRLGPLMRARAAEAERGARRRRRVARVSAALFGSAAAAALLLVSFVHRPAGRRDDDDDRTAGDRAKGSAALTVHVKRGGAGRAGGAATATTIDRINGEGGLRAGDEMRFSVTTAQPGYAIVLGLDAAPSVTAYVPAAGSAERSVRVEPPGPVALPGSVIADDTAGFERVVAVICRTEVPLETLRRQAQSALDRAAGRPDAVASLGTGCAESSVLLRKAAAQ